MWNYYDITVDQSFYGLVITIEETTVGDADLFVKKGELPTRSSYDYRDNTQNATFSIAIANQTSGGKWFIGVYGYNVVTYSIIATITTSCPNDCSNHGTCNQGVCTCSQGWIGVDCSNALTTINFNQNYQSTIGSGQYVYYVINNPLRRDISINAQQSGTTDVDLFIKFNELPTFLNWDYKEISTNASFSLPVPSAQIGNWYIGFYGYGQTSFSFNVTFSTNGCVSNCSGSAHGYCFSNNCVCGEQYTGTYCEEFSPSIQLSKHYSGDVEKNAWNYYHISSLTSNNLVITLNQTVNNEDCDLFVKSGSKPTRASYDYRDISLNALSSITINNPLDKTWYIGVDGFANCHYDIIVTETSSCPSNCNSRGSCTTNGECICNTGYTGVACESVLLYPQAGQINVGGVRSGEWTYYFFNATTSYVSFQLLETNSTGKLWLYISQTQFPTLQNFHQNEVSVLKDFHQIQNKFTSSSPRQYFIGIYGNPYITQDIVVNYNFVVWSPPF
eukprot:TRINITY_DN6077_c0_g1_i1.p1 TRINITY_DN6077_c0_g1~~TRINITY_DN6077_c0_g1_i1.p1  ORF type:complete len:579 (+),score=115.62 TRINITY_DN6077_c0_g1_i1:233-1738(+)